MSSTGVAVLPETIAEAAAWLRAGRVTSEGLTAACLARAHAAQEALGAFITFTDDSALAAARRADAELAAGIDRGPLQGVPLGLKDVFATSDAPTTGGSRALDRDWDTRPEATVVRRLRAAGSVILGKLALHELAIGWPDPGMGFPIARNPWDLTRTPGSSSTGVAAAVAAGIILGGIGTDTGGSISIPAAYCGICGIKPTYGRVSRSGCVPLAPSLDHVGPLARTARDCAMLLQAIASHDPADPATVEQAVPNYIAALDGSLTETRIGLPRPFFFDRPGLDDDVRDAIETAIRRMAEAGAVVEEIALPHADEAASAQFVISTSEAYAQHEIGLRTNPERFGRNAKQALQLGALLTAADYVQAQRVRTVIRQHWAREIARFDVLIVPATFSPATPIDLNQDTRLLRAKPTTPWNLVGFPAMSIPCGLTRAGLPIGLEIVGGPFGEITVLKIADAYQCRTDWHTKRPDLTWLDS